MIIKKDKCLTNHKPIIGMKTKINYEITIGYKAVICVAVKAESEKEAKEKAIEIIKKRKDRFYGIGVELLDDNFNADGILNMDATWNMYDR